jgi:ribose-phosphate pyrophosphokinase
MGGSKLENDIRIFTGNANPALAEAICRELGVPLGQAEVDRFPDGETKVRLTDDVRGRDVFIIQPTSPPVNDHLVELLVLMDAVRRSSAERITAVIPYYGYARQDRKHEGRVPITAKLVANLISAAGANRVICMDLHATQIQGFFDIPMDHLYAWPVMLEHLRTMNLTDLTVLSPDPGRLKLANSFAKRLSGEIAFIDKRRTSDSEVERGYVVGEIRGRNVLIMDDMVTTGGTLRQAVEVARECGAREVLAMATHPIFCGRAFERLSGLPVKELAVCDTIPVHRAPVNLNLVVLSVAGLLAQAIRRTHDNESISSLFV